MEEGEHYHVAEDCTGGDDKSALIACPGGNDDDDAGLDPYEGMEFDSEEAAKGFYAAYARRAGFRIRISRYTRSRRDNSVISRRIVCSKEGFREDRPVFGSERRRHRQRAATRVGCKAMIMVKKIGAGKWSVSKFVKEHNHGPVPPRKVEARDVRIDDEPVEKPLVSDGDVVVEEEPFEGMEFDSEEAAKMYYTGYARQTGFRARISKYCRSRRDNSIISRQIVCSKEGFREIRVKKEDSDEARAKRPRVVTRIGCKAMIIVKKLNSGNWVVSKFEREHNHALVDSMSAPLLRSHDSTERIPITGSNCPGTQGSPSLYTTTVLYNQLCCEAIRYAQEGATTVETFNVAMSALREAVEKVAAAKRGTFLVSGTDQGVAIPVVSEAKQALAGQELLLLQQPVSFVLIPYSSVNPSAEALVILNAANDQIVATPSDTMNTACSNPGIETVNVEVQPSPATPTPCIEGLPANGEVGSDLPAGSKRELEMTDGNVEPAAVQKYQKLDTVRVSRIKTAPRTRCKLSSPSFSGTQMVAIPALPVTLYLPATGSLPGPCSVATPGTPGGASAAVQAGSHQQRAEGAPHRDALTPNSPPEPYTGPNPRVHATAMAAGARTVPPKAAASLIKAIEARIKSGRVLALPGSIGGCKLLAVEAAPETPRPHDSENCRRASTSQAHEDYQVQGASSEDPRFQKAIESQEDVEGHSVVADVIKTQMVLVEASGGC